MGGNHPNHVLALRAKRHSNTDFASKRSPTSTFVWRSAWPRRTLLAEIRVVQRDLGLLADVLRGLLGRLRLHLLFQVALYVLELLAAPFAHPDDVIAERGLNRLADLADRQ